MTVCRDCLSVECGYRELSFEEKEELGYDTRETVMVCAECGSELISEFDEDYGLDR